MEGKGPEQERRTLSLKELDLEQQELSESEQKEQQELSESEQELSESEQKEQQERCESRCEQVCEEKKLSYSEPEGGDPNDPWFKAYIKIKQEKEKRMTRSKDWEEVISPKPKAGIKSMTRNER